MTDNRSLPCIDNQTFTSSPVSKNSKISYLLKPFKLNLRIVESYTYANINAI